jgi:thiopeptide-type bacteriocin biosynthesis protein
MSHAWLRYDLDAAPVPPALYRTLSDATQRLTDGGVADDIFFVHTPDGVRLRCRAADPQAADRAWLAVLAAAGRRGLLRAVRQVGHEPQQVGLGGPTAMASAHRVFTADSVAWLGYHSHRERPTPTIPRWAMSVLMIRALLAAAGGARWEITDVWDRVARVGEGRPRLAGDSAGRVGEDRPRLAEDPAVRRLAFAIRTGWEDPGLLRDRLSDDQARLLTRYETAVSATGARWLATPATGQARRHGVALAVTFHWNRSAMPARHRHLLATALAVAQPALVAA